MEFTFKTIAQGLIFFAMCYFMLASIIIIGG